MEYVRSKGISGRTIPLTGKAVAAHNSHVRFYRDLEKLTVLE